MKWKLFLVCLAVVFAISCRTTSTNIYLDQREVKPATNEYSIYKNKDLMLTIYSTPKWYYSDALGDVSYTSFPSLYSYMVDVYQDMFMKAGFIVYQAKPTARIVPELRLTISALSDETMTMDALLTLDEGIRLKKTYTIKMPPSKQTDKIEDLQKKAYRMVEQSGMAILNDPAFQKAYSGIFQK